MKPVSASLCGTEFQHSRWGGMRAEVTGVDSMMEQRERDFFFTRKSKVKGENKGWMGHSFLPKNFL